MWETKAGKPIASDLIKQSYQQQAEQSTAERNTRLTSLSDSPTPPSYKELTQSQPTRPAHPSPFCYRHTLTHTSPHVPHARRSFGIKVIRAGHVSDGTDNQPKTPASLAGEVKNKQNLGHLCFLFPRDIQASIYGIAREGLIHQQTRWQCAMTKSVCCHHPAGRHHRTISEVQISMIHPKTILAAQMAPVNTRQVVLMLWFISICKVNGYK